MSFVAFPVSCQCLTSVHRFLINTVSAEKVEDVLSLEKMFKNTLEPLEKLKAAGFILNWTLSFFLEDLGSLIYYLSAKDIAFLFTILNILILNGSPNMEKRQHPFRQLL